jgi:signal transduction histidine kinase
LRTPLVSIIGFAELLAEFMHPETKVDTRLKRYANNILISGRMLLDIINDLLDLAKIEAGKLELHLTDVTPIQLCEPLIDFLTPMADKKSIQLTLMAQADLPVMHSDAGRIKQILYNLLSNALKFTPEKGAVKLRVYAGERDAITFSVSDTGPGIDEAQQATIFEKFRQLDSSVTREYGGTGLGLAITRELAAMLGGRVHLRSAAGEGSTFTVMLPVLAPAEARVPLVNLT